MVRKTTKEILAESFMELTATKPISKISIVDIVENCAMTKPTFYRYFKDKYDLMAWLFVRAAQSNVNKIGTDGYVWRDTLLDGLPPAVDRQAAFHEPVYPRNAPPSQYVNWQPPTEGLHG